MNESAPLERHHNGAVSGAVEEDEILLRYELEPFKRVKCGEALERYVTYLLLPGYVRKGRSGNRCRQHRAVRTQLLKIDHHIFDREGKHLLQLAANNKTDLSPSRERKGKIKEITGCIIERDAARLIVEHFLQLFQVCSRNRP